MNLPTAPLDYPGSIRREEVLAAITKMRDLPAAAPVVHNALACMAAPDFQMAKLKRILMSDQALAARILRLANSAYFGFRTEVRTVSQAVILLGQNRIRTVLLRILADRLLMEMANLEPAAAVRKTSLTTATASCLLSQLLAREDPEEMLLAGLLHNIGELFLLSRFPRDYDRLGIPCGTIGKWLLEAWAFPPLYPAAAEFIDDPLAPDSPGEMVLLHAGKKLAEGFLSKLSAGDSLLRISSQICDMLNLDGDLVLEVHAAIPKRMSLEQLQAGRNS